MIFFYFMGWALIISGGIFVVTGAIGCLKFDNFFSALHAASVADNGGMILILLGIICQNGLVIFSAKILALLIIIIITSPTNSHILSKAAIDGGVKILPEKL